MNLKEYSERDFTRLVVSATKLEEFVRSVILLHDRGLLEQLKLDLAVHPNARQLDNHVERVAWFWITGGSAGPVNTDASDIPSHLTNSDHSTVAQALTAYSKNKPIIAMMFRRAISLLRTN